MKNLKFFKSAFLLGLMTLSIHSQDFKLIRSGYGSKGPYSVKVETTTHPTWSKRKIALYRPENVNKKAPVILFAHGYTGTYHQIYGTLLTYMASQGYACLLAPTSPLQSPEKMYQMHDVAFEAGVKAFKNYIDTTRVGFAGHSFGGGYVPWMAYQYLVKKKWGEKGSFLMPLAPWYTLKVTNEMLKEFPGNTHLLMQVYEQDTINDHRMAVDIYRRINIAKDKKDYIVLMNDTAGTNIIYADHAIPTSHIAPKATINHFDQYGVIRLMHALADCVFHQNLTAKKIALGNGSEEQLWMGETLSGRVFKKSLWLPFPYALDKESFYVNKWSSNTNPRRMYSVRIESNHNRIKGNSNILPKWVHFKASGKLQIPMVNINNRNLQINGRTSFIRN